MFQSLSVNLSIFKVHQLYFTSRPKVLRNGPIETQYRMNWTKNNLFKYKKYILLLPNLEGQLPNPCLSEFPHRFTHR